MGGGGPGGISGMRIMTPGGGGGPGGAPGGRIIMAIIIWFGCTPSGSGGGGGGCSGRGPGATVSRSEFDVTAAVASDEVTTGVCAADTIAGTRAGASLGAADVDACGCVCNGAEGGSLVTASGTPALRAIPGGSEGGGGGTNTLMPGGMAMPGGGRTGAAADGACCCCWGGGWATIPGGGRTGADATAECAVKDEDWRLWGADEAEAWCCCCCR